MLYFVSCLTALSEYFISIENQRLEIKQSNINAGQCQNRPQRIRPPLLHFPLRRLPRHHFIIKSQSHQHVEEHIKGDLRRAHAGLDLRHPRLADPELPCKSGLRQFLVLSRLEQAVSSISGPISKFFTWVTTHCGPSSGSSFAREERNLQSSSLMRMLKVFVAISAPSLYLLFGIFKTTEDAPLCSKPYCSSGGTASSVAV